MKNPYIGDIQSFAIRSSNIFVVSNHKIVSIAIVDNSPSSSSGLSVLAPISSTSESRLAVFLITCELESSDNLTSGFTFDFKFF